MGAATPFAHLKCFPKVDFYTKFHQNWTKILEVNQLHAYGSAVGRNKFFNWLISQADHKGTIQNLNYILRRLKVIQLQKLNRKAFIRHTT